MGGGAGGAMRNQRKAGRGWDEWETWQPGGFSRLPRENRVKDGLKRGGGACKPRQVFQTAQGRCGSFMFSRA